MNIIYAFLMALFVGNGSSQAIPYDKIEKSFQAAKAIEIINECRDKVIINIQNQEGVYGSSQAQQVLKDFFATYPPKGFVFTFKGKESGANSFALGLYTSDRKKFSVSIKFTMESKVYKIESIKIVQEA